MDAHGMWCETVTCDELGEVYCPATPLIIEGSETSRGFQIYKFNDRYDEPCTLQESSLATEAAIWLGTEGRCVQGPPWKDNHFTLPSGVLNKSRMHLTQRQVAELLPFLQRFADTGSLEES